MYPGQNLRIYIFQNVDLKDFVWVLTCTCEFFEEPVLDHSVVNCYLDVTFIEVFIVQIWELLWNHICKILKFCILFLLGSLPTFDNCGWSTDWIQYSIHQTVYVISAIYLHWKTLKFIIVSLVPFFKLNKIESYFLIVFKQLRTSLQIILNSDYFSRNERLLRNNLRLLD